jgi:alpha-tubulin suppressor-like RCC1 family protein
MGLRNVQDIFCANNHSFLLTKNGQLKGWGLNNYGQLGVGHMENSHIPLPIDLDNVKLVAGGEHHTIALTHDNVVYAWGRNDDYQLGLGNTEEFSTP